MRDREIIQLTLWRLRELFREPEALFWVFAFPLLLAIALGLAFKVRGAEELPVGVVELPGAARLAEALAATPGFVVTVGDSAGVHELLRTGKLILAIAPGDPSFIRTIRRARKAAWLACVRTTRFRPMPGASVRSVCETATSSNAGPGTSTS